MAYLEPVGLQFIGIQDFGARQLFDISGFSGLPPTARSLGTESRGGYILLRSMLLARALAASVYCWEASE